MMAIAIVLLGAPAQMRISPNHEFQKIAPLRALTKTHKIVQDEGQTTLTFSSPITIATMLPTLAFISNIGHNIQLFAKSFRSRVRGCISDTATKAFCDIFTLH
jgi:hypothetical protein